MRIPRSAAVRPALCLLVPGLSALIASAGLAADGPRTVRSPDSALRDHETLVLRELWRAGNDGDVFFGEIVALISDEQGRVYALDGQQCQVQVFDVDGQHLRTLSRQGDGPGEVRHPSDLYLMPGGALAIIEGYPPQLVLLQRDGIPSGTVRIAPPGEATEGMRFFDNADLPGGAFGDDLLVSGSDDLYADGSRTQTRFVSRFGTDTREVTRYYESERVLQGRHFPLVERNDYFPHGDLHCTGPNGRVYVAPRRDSYRIEVFEPDGTPHLVIERDFDSRKRDAYERERVWASYQGHAGRHGSETQVEVEDTEPDIVALHVAPDGHLWVQHSRSHLDQAEGVLLAFDVFAPDGRLAREVAIACEGDPRRDRLVPLPDGRWVRIAGAIDAHYAEAGGGFDHGEEGDVPLEIICYGPE